MNRRNLGILILSVAAFWLTAGVSHAQTTEFTYQGSLNNGGTAANGNYDFEFALFDSAAGGTQLGSTAALNSVPVSDGIFSAKLDFGNQFPGSERFLEIRVRQAGQPAFTTLTPRQKLSSGPYAVKSLNAQNATTAENALQLGGVAAGQYVVTTDPRMTDARNPNPGSASYIQNTTSQQTASYFISGDGTVLGTLRGFVVNAASHFTVNGLKILHVPGTPALGNFAVGVLSGSSMAQGGLNSFFGFQSGKNTTDGSGNSFFGSNAGLSNTFGNGNSFFGQFAGRDNVTGAGNSFFGTGAGLQNIQGNNNAFFGDSAGRLTTADINSFFGARSGENNTTGNANSFFGFGAGLLNTEGNSNSFIGREAGVGNTTGSFNLMIGLSAGSSNTTGSNNTVIGTISNLGSNNLTNATAIGARSFVTADNSLVLGSISGVNGATANTRVGIGTTAPEKTLHVKGPGAQEVMVESSDASGRKWTIQASGDSGSGRFEVVDRTAAASRMAILADGKVGIGTTAPENRFQVNGAIQVTGARSTPAGSALVLSGESTFDSVQSFNNRPLVLNGVGNNVGVGTQAPADKLDVNGIIRVSQLGSAGATPLCRNASSQISSCSSSARYKSDIADFRLGLPLIRGLRPVSFRWTNGEMLDLGLVAEEVAEVEPLLTTRNAAGEIEGVKYDRIGIVLVNAVNEQQAELERQKEKVISQNERIVQLEAELTAVKALVCIAYPDAKVCKQ